MAEGILHHETPYASTGVEHGKNKQRLKHDGEVIPDSHHRLAAQAVGKDLGHTDRERRSAASAIEQSLLTHSVRERGHAVCADRKSPTADGSRSRIRSLADNPRRTVDGEISSRLQHT